MPAEPCTPYLGSHSPDHGNADTYSAAYLGAVFRKLGMRLLPVFFLLNILNYLDRANLAFASINMSQSLKLTSEGPLPSRFLCRLIVAESALCSPCR